MPCEHKDKGAKLRGKCIVGAWLRAYLGVLGIVNDGNTGSGSDEGRGRGLVGRGWNSGVNWWREGWIHFLGEEKLKKMRRFLKGMKKTSFTVPPPCCGGC